MAAIDFSLLGWKKKKPFFLSCGNAGVFKDESKLQPYQVKFHCLRIVFFLPLVIQPPSEVSARIRRLARWLPLETGVPRLVTCGVGPHEVSLPRRHYFSYCESVGKNVRRMEVLDRAENICNYDMLETYAYTP